jgi:hypothetical protein
MINQVSGMVNLKMENIIAILEIFGGLINAFNKSGQIIIK